MRAIIRAPRGRGYDHVQPYRFRGGTDTKTIAVSVTDTPTLTVPGGQRVTVGHALELFGGSNAITVTDPTAVPGEIFTLEINHSASNGAGFTILPEGGTSNYTTNGNLLVTGTLSQLNAALATLDYASNNPGVIPGPDTITLNLTDSVGGTDTKTIAVEVDATIPATPTVSNAAVVNAYVNAANDTAGQSLGGTAEAGDTINVYLNGATAPAFTTTADGSGNWNVTLGAQADGSYSYTATATDAADNVSAPSAPLSFMVDTSTSESAIADSAVTTSADGLNYINATNFNGGATTFSGQAAAGDTVSVAINGWQTVGSACGPFDLAGWDLDNDAQRARPDGDQIIGRRDRERPGRKHGHQRSFQLHRRHDAALFPGGVPSRSIPKTAGDDAGFTVAAGTAVTVRV